MEEEYRRNAKVYCDLASNMPASFIKTINDKLLYNRTKLVVDPENAQDIDVFICLRKISIRLINLIRKLNRNADDEPIYTSRLRITALLCAEYIKEKSK